MVMTPYVLEFDLLTLKVSLETLSYLNHRGPEALNPKP